MAEEGEGEHGGAESVSIVELVIKAVDELTEPIEKAEKSLRGLISDLRQAAASTFEIFAGYETLERFIEPAGEMQAKLTDLAIAAGTTIDKLGEAKEQAEDLATTYGRSAEEIVETETALYRQTGELEKALATTSAAVEYAAVTHESLRAAARGLIETYNILGDKTKPIEEGIKDVGNVLTVLKTQYDLGEISASRFARSMAYIKGESDKFHLPVGQLEGMIAALGRLGYQGSRSLSIVRTAIDHVFGGTKGLAERWSKFGLEIGRDPKTGLIDFIATLEHADKEQHDAFQRFIQASGQTGNVLALLVKNIEMWQEATHNVVHSQGKLDEAAEKVRGTWVVAYADMKQAINDLMDAIGTEMLPTATAVVEAFTRMIVSFQKFAEAHPYVIEFIAGFVAFVAVLITIAGLFGAVIGYLALVSTSLTILGTSISAIVLGFGSFIVIFGALAVFVYDNWTDIVRIWEWGVTQIKDFMVWWNRFVNDPWTETRLVWERGKSWLSNMFSEIGTIISNAWNHPLQAAEELWKGIKAGALDLSEFITRQSLSTLAIGEIIALSFGGIWGGALYLIVVGIAELIVHWKDFVNFLKNEVVPAIETAWNGVSAVFKDVVNSIGDSLNALKNFMSPVFDWIGDKLQWIENLLKAFEEAWKSLGDMGGLFGGTPPAAGAPSGPYGGAPGGLPVPVPEPVPAMPMFGGVAWHSSSTYSPNLTINVSSSEKPDDIADAVRKVLDDNREQFAQQMQDHMLNQRRTAFNDLVYNT